MTRLAWQTVERWQARTEMGVIELWLLNAVDGQHSQAWRVEWGRLGGYRNGVTFAGADREQRARAELDRRKGRYIRIWQLIS